MTKNEFGVRTLDGTPHRLRYEECPDDFQALEQMDAVAEANVNGTLSSPAIDEGAIRELVGTRGTEFGGEVPMTPPPAATSPTSLVTADTTPELLKSTIVDADTLNILANHYNYKLVGEVRDGLEPKNFPSQLETRVYGQWEKLVDVNLTQGTTRTVEDTVVSGMTVSLEASMTGLLGVAKGALSSGASDVFGMTVNISPQKKEKTTTNFEADKSAADTRFIVWQQVITMGFYLPDGDTPFVWLGAYYGPHNYKNRDAKFFGGPFVERGATHIDRFTFST